VLSGSQIKVSERTGSQHLAHWEAWVDKELPALSARTLREAVRDSDGREAMEALLIDAERRGGDDPTMDEMNHEGIRLARALLGLIKPTLADKQKTESQGRHFSAFPCCPCGKI
jgi:hypothetical protein